MERFSHTKNVSCNYSKYAPRLELSKHPNVSTRSASLVGRVPKQSIFVHNNIISCYVSLGEVLVARKLFDQMPNKSAVSYNTLISAYSRCGDVKEGCNLLAEMRGYGIGPTQFTLAGMLSCGSLNYCHGVQLQAFSIKNGLFEADAFVGTALMGLFGKHGFLEEAYWVFKYMTEKSLVTWNSMLSLLAHNGLVEDCMLLFRDLVRMGASLADSSFVGVLSGLASKQDLEYGEEIHGLMIKHGLDYEVTAVNSLVNMYVKCKGIVLAEKLFQHVPVWDVVTWNTIIDAVAKSERPEKALELFLDMYRRGVMPSQATFVTVINSCTSLETPVYGESVHAEVIRRGFDTDVLVGTALISFYAKCYKMEHAHRCFDEISEKNVVSWNALILGYSNRNSSTSILLLQKMLQLGYQPDEFSFSAVLRSLMASELHQVHCLIIKMGYVNNEYILSSLVLSCIRNGLSSAALVILTGFGKSPLPVVPTNVVAGVYNRTGQYYESLKLLSLLEEPDVVSWNLVIAACSRSNNYREVFELFKHMLLAHILPDNYTFMSLLSVCTKLCNLDFGSSVHGLIIKTNFNCCDKFVCNVLIDMYGKCGSIRSSVKIFDEMTDRNIITWTALITALGLNGYALDALERFQNIEFLGLEPDGVALTAVLRACRHGGLVREGMELFRRMKSSFGVEPELDHYHCIVDLLAKNGYIKEAEKIIESMPFPPTVNIWRSFLEGYKRQETAKLSRPGT
ncbi:Pentatricopeptide repeat-containing protein [Quillaja saponaria]|uniref:Pentatricopeptide repeat-containing protein n=1 Tax=Quillaja saponaria TaxID=32244 RepID=A0AAD7QIS4_QUISA|nr:Pentatricopeptide repeat-containing protein [Quillaja saponaria]